MTGTTVEPSPSLGDGATGWCPAPPLGVSRVALRDSAEAVSPCGGPAALLFADVAGYTSFAERHSPREVIETLDRYFRAVTAPVISRGGRVVDYYGDGVFAVFTPSPGEPDGAYARNALDAAVHLFGALNPFNEALSDRLGERFAVRAGLHVGRVVRGTVGPPGARKEAVVGDAVNVAARVEAANKVLGTRLLVTEQALAAAAPASPDGAASVDPSLGWVPLCAAHLFEVDLPGKAERFRLYEVET